MNNKELFTYVDSKNIKRSIEIDEGDFKLVQENVHLHDDVIKTKPTTFMRDAMKRFAKNKSSVAGAIILGTIITLSIILPFALPSDIDSVHPYEKFLAPKLFDVGTGWWDGTRELKEIPVAIDWAHWEETGGENGGELLGFPAPEDYEARAIVGGQEGVRMTAYGERRTNQQSQYAYGGYIRFNTPAGAKEVVSMTSPEATFYFDYYNYSVDLKLGDSVKEGFKQASYAVYFVDMTDPNDHKDILLKDFSTDVTDFSVSFSATEHPEFAGMVRGGLSIRLAQPSGEEEDLLVKKVLFNIEKGTLDPNEDNIARMEEISIPDANQNLGFTPSDNPERFWTAPSPAGRSVYQADIIFSSFRYDTYELAYGDQRLPVSDNSLNIYINKGWITGNTKSVDDLKREWRTLPTTAAREAATIEFVEALELTPEGVLHCPLRLGDEYEITVKLEYAGDTQAFTINGVVSRWRELGYSSMPKYLMGTDVDGRDLVHYAFAGLRTSLILGLVSAVVCFSFGLVWGAISGYFGGWVDIWMERFCEILGGLPWIVLMTFMMIYFGQSYLTFAIAICLTGWMGTAHLTRTQFYRFKDREYILAARTLGANDFRLIFRHILPNAVGTIVTAAVLMIPSTIYSEASIAYLGLGLKNVSSFGVMLSDNQKFLGLYPQLILFPSAIMALMMISFNLFGNGLRDAFNPSLKGQD